MSSRPYKGGTPTQFWSGRRHKRARSRSGTDFSFSFLGEPIFLFKGGSLARTRNSSVRQPSSLLEIIVREDFYRSPMLLKKEEQYINLNRSFVKDKIGIFI